MSNTIIESLGTYLPSGSQTTEEVVEGCKKKIRFPLARITGIDSRRVAGNNEFSIDLAMKAVEDCLNKSKYNASEIDLLICCNISRVDGPNMLSFEPSTSLKLKKHFGFSNALVFDISNACAGMFTGIYIVNNFLEVESIQRAMVVSGEYITHLAKTAQREIESFMDDRIACLTLGDAGAALILEKGVNVESGFHNIDLQTYGHYSPYCTAKEAESGGLIMHTDSVSLTDVAMKQGTNYALNMLDKTGWKADECQQLIMHQTSRMTLNSARNEINNVLKNEVFNDDNAINNLGERGNTASTSHMVAVADQIRKNKIQSGDKIIFSIAASGLTVGTALYIFDNLPDRIRQDEFSKAKELKIPLHKREPKKKKTGLQIESIGTISEEMNSGVDSMELAYSAAKNCLEKSAYQSKDIDLVIYCGVYRTEYLLEPAYATLLAGKLDINASPSAVENKTLAFDIFNGSVGFMNGIYTAQNLMAAGKCKKAMIITAEIENNAGLFPDELVGVKETASAIILDAHSSMNKGFSLFHFGYDVSSLKAFTSYSTYSLPDEPRYRMNIEKQIDLEDKYISSIQLSVAELLKQEELSLDQIDTVIPPQISSDFIAQLGIQLNLPQEKFVNVVGDGPDLFSSSLVYGFDKAIKEKLVKPGDIVLVITVGSGIQVGCAIYNF